MKNKIPVQFKDCSSLVEDLKKKSKNYPLIARLYIPIIENHAKKYEKHYSSLDISFDDWLHIPYFLYLWRSEDPKYGQDYKKLLQRIEGDLKLISDSLGDDEFENLCIDLLGAESVMHPAVNGVYNNVLSFYGELKGMSRFINKGYTVERIPRSKVKGRKTPDFLASKENEIAVVECKFIHPSNIIKTFINRYIIFLHRIPGFSSIKHMKSCDRFNYKFDTKGLGINHILNIKDFINDIIFERKKEARLSLNCKCNCTIGYESRDQLDTCLVTIDDQVSFLGFELKKFFDSYVLRRVEQANKQVESYPGKKIIYLFIELDGQLNPPFEEMDHKKECVKREFIENIFEEYKKKYELDDVDVIIDFFV